MRHPETYLGLPMPDPISSESGKGTRGSPAPTLGFTGSGSRIRVSQRDCSTTACSPSGERATAPLARVETEAGKETNEARACEEPAARPFCSWRESCVTVHRRWTAHSLSGHIRPRWASEITAQAFAAFSAFRAGWSEPFFVSLGRNLIRILKFFWFFFFLENRMIKKFPKNKYN
jgi:hypothetical protein